jgi:hypothetical protein
VSCDRLHGWMFATRWWQPGGSGGVDDVFVQRHDPGIGAEIMGAGKFGHPGWHEDREWKGAWGANPPFHTPVFVLTHHPRRSIEMEGSLRRPRRSKQLARLRAARTYVSAEAPP